MLRPFRLGVQLRALRLGTFRVPLPLHRIFANVSGRIRKLLPIPQEPLKNNSSAKPVPSSQALGVPAK
jgi:hypothetical protein